MTDYNLEAIAQSLQNYVLSIPELETKFSLAADNDSSHAIFDSKPPDAWYNNTFAAVNNKHRGYVFELASKKFIYQYINENSSIDVAAGSSDPTIAVMGTLIDLVTFLTKSTTQTEHTLPLLLIEVLFEIQTISWCSRFWPYLISREATLTRNLTGTKAPGTTLIRLCNALLKRLSKNQNAHFSGEIAIFLARAFPLTEKSGLNIRGTFNTDNETAYENDLPETDNRDEAALNNLYKTFWSLQSFFSDPVQLTASPEKLAEFKNSVNEVLPEMKKREAAAGSNKRERDNEQRLLEMEASDNDDEGYFVPKWLTRRDLFDKQLKDVTFRRSALTQISIIIDFLLGLTEKAKKRWTSAEVAANNKSVMFNFTLSAADEADFLQIQKSIQRPSLIVYMDPPYLRTINTVLQRDRYWQVWKLQNCPSFEEPPLPATDFEKAQDKFENTLIKPRRKFWHAMGTPALSKIWKIKMGIDALSHKNRYIIPEARSYYTSIKEATEKFTEEHTVEVPEEEPGPSPEPTNSAEATTTKNDVKMSDNADKEKHGVDKESDKTSETSGNKETNKNLNAESQTKEKSENKPQDRKEGAANGAENVGSDQISALPSPLKFKKVVKVSKEEQKQFDNQISSKTWRGLRAARAQGYWAKFGLVTELTGFSGLFETPSTFSSEKKQPKNGCGELSTANSEAPTPAPHNDSTEQNTVEDLCSRKKRSGSDVFEADIGEPAKSKLKTEATDKPVSPAQSAAAFSPIMVVDTDSESDNDVQEVEPIKPTDSVLNH
jgi:THO complex subunit 1